MAKQETTDKPSDDDTQSSASELPVTRKVESEYDVDQMRYMSDLEHVRERSGMYIGDTSIGGLHHLVYEVIDNSIDEIMAEHATEIRVTVNVDGSITISDNGRGIPVAIDKSMFLTGAHDERVRFVRMEGAKDL